MPSITLKNIPESLYLRLTEAARRHHRSLSEEIVAALEIHVGQQDRDKQALLDRIRAVRGRYQPTIRDEDIADWKGAGRRQAPDANR